MIYSGEGQGAFFECPKCKKDVEVDELALGWPTNLHLQPSQAVSSGSKASSLGEQPTGHG